MERSPTLVRLEDETSVSVARAGAALSLGLALWLAPHLFLSGMVGSLGMYAVTDGVFASITGCPRTERAARLAGALSLLMGFVIMLAGGGARGLLLLFALRSLAVALVELGLGLEAAGLGESLVPRASGALRRYAALLLAGTSAAFLALAAAGHGALALSSWLAWQLVLWAALLLAHVRRRVAEPARKIAAG